ncbi:unnamed protein product [Parnassius apollo]|uniref:(apollo) hypothetical protein n=1 Tax=Parnassius apollo TaxID=110799 RepID=A0A8S3WMX6_PARAO|nr:unnamed protein product [Parnassius apollo]
MPVFKLTLLFFAIIFISIVNSDHLNVGTSVNSELAYVEDVKLSAIPTKKRTKNVFYNSETNPKIIKGITAVDYLNSKAKATVTSGGVGSTFANIKLKSERGSGLNYQVQIFV